MNPVRQRILLFCYRPPPEFGPSVLYDALLRSEFARRHELHLINLSVVEHIAELGRLSLRKVAKLAGFFFRECWQLLTRRPDWCCYPLAFNRLAFLKDWVLIRTAQIAGVPVLLYAHGTGLATFRATLSPRLQGAFDRLVSRSAGVIVLAECLREDFAGLMPADRIHVAWPGVEPQAELPARRPHPDLRVVYLGALVTAKGVLDLIRAFPLVRERQPTATLTLAGDWADEAGARSAHEFIRAQKLEPVVTFTGRVSGLAKWQLLRDADVFVFPVHSATESFGLVMLEAMQAGLPIVATRGGARSEVLADGVNALFAAEQNPADLADAIARLLADAPLRERMGRANRERFFQMFTHESYGQRMMEVLARCRSR